MCSSHASMPFINAARLLLQQGEENIGTSPTGSAATGLAALAGRGIGDRFASIAQAAFTAAVADNPESAAATAAGVRPTFMIRSATGGRHRNQLDGVRAYKSYNSAPAKRLSPHWRLGGSRAASPAATGAARSDALSRESIPSHRGASPRSAVRSGSPAASVGGNSATFLGMPPFSIAEAAGQGEHEMQERSPVAAGERCAEGASARPSGWGAIRALLKPKPVDTPSGPAAAAPAEPSPAALHTPAAPQPHPSSAHGPNSGTGTHAAAPVAQGVTPQIEAKGTGGADDDDAVRAVARIWRAGHSGRSAQHAVDDSSKSPNGTARTARPQHEDATARAAPGASRGLPVTSSRRASQSTQHSKQHSTQHSTDHSGRVVLHEHQKQEGSTASLERAGDLPIEMPAMAALDPTASARELGAARSQHSSQHAQRGVRTDGAGPSRTGSAAWRGAASLAAGHQSAAAAACDPPAGQLPHSTHRDRKGGRRVKTLPSFPRSAATGAESDRESSSSSSLDSAA